MNDKIQKNQTEYVQAMDSFQIIATRKFIGPVDLLWRTWTDPEIIDQWWAPKPYKSVTKAQVFEEGGYRLYSMEGPDGERQWCKNEYSKIESPFFYAGDNGFCDEEGNYNSDLPVMHWEVYFSGEDEGTKVKVITTFKSLEELEKIVDMGFQEGFAAAHENLDFLLADLYE